MNQLLKHAVLAAAVAALAVAGSATGSSHREAPLITETPKVDGTDFYMSAVMKRVARATSPSSPTTFRCGTRTAGRTIS